MNSEETSIVCGNSKQQDPNQSTAKRVQSSDSSNVPTSTVGKSPVPPPSFVRNVTNYRLMLEEITKTITAITFLAKSLAENTVKVTVDT